MAPVGHFGNVATFHGIPDTTNLNIQTNSMFEMPKLSATVPLGPQTSAMNSFPTFHSEIAQNNPSAVSVPVSPFVPPNLLMTCNFSFLNPQALALYFQLQQQQQTATTIPQQPTPATPMSAALNPFAHLMPMFSTAPLINGSPQPVMPVVSNGHGNVVFPQLSTATQQQTPPTPAYFNGTPMGSFSFPTINTVKPTPTFALINNQTDLNSASTQQSLPEGHIFAQQSASLPPTLEANRPPSLRCESPFDHNLPPVLEPELPCLASEFEDFGAPPDLMPVQLAFADEPPLLEPEVHRSDSPTKPLNRTSPLQLPSLPIAATPLTSSSSAITSATTSPIETAPPSSIHPLLYYKALLRSPAKFAISTPTVASVAPSTPSIPTISAASPTGRGKRERSSSVDSNSESMLKMPKLMPMNMEFDDTESSETITRADDDQMTADVPTITLEAKDDFRSRLSSGAKTPVLSESTIALLSNNQPASVETPTDAHVVGEELKIESQQPLPSMLTPLVVETVNATQPTETSILSSSGVSSADSSLLAEEPVSAAYIPIAEPNDESKKVPFVEYDDRTPESISPSLSPAPLTPVHNTKLRPRPSQQSTKPKKSTKAKSRTPRRSGGRKKQKRVRSVSIKSNWQPVDEGQIHDVRLAHETQYQRRRCYAEIRHQRERDEVIRVRDCVRVRSSEGLENVGKIIRLFLDDSCGSICAEVFWYYAPTQVSDDISKNMHEKELLASKHCDVINVDAIEEHAFVLSYSEYCRFVAETRIDEMPPERRPLESCEVWSRGDENYQRRLRLPHEDTPIDLVYFCRHVYSLRTRKIRVSGTSRRGSKSNGGRKTTRCQR
ncbi:Bromo adjacent-like proteiny domain-containing 1 protein [Aphelenchoides besseyi]|nr:Bromo adjacent-like proteiny domain-containing 1 protein [Aphelenchoides besseyi]KAI6236901.1 Bromo adjacent-like proteiny domain-containing 1 protein [Aphelenchoides besseyi]